jgi:hypothetical protein
MKGSLEDQQLRHYCELMSLIRISEQKRLMSRASVSKATQYGPDCWGVKLTTHILVANIIIPLHVLLTGTGWR